MTTKEEKGSKEAKEEKTEAKIAEKPSEEKKDLKEEIKPLKEKLPEKKIHSKGHKGPFEWVEYKPQEIKEVIINLANTGNTPAQVGMILRDQYGIPNVKKVLGKKVEEFFDENNLLQEVPFDLLNLIRKSVQVEKHLKENKKDMTAKRGFQLTVSKIRRLVRYYHKSGKLSKDWKYTSDRARLLIK